VADRAVHRRKDGQPFARSVENFLHRKGIAVGQRKFSRNFFPIIRREINPQKKRNEFSALSSRELSASLLVDAQKRTALRGNSPSRENHKRK
jgi:hypothetical protein